MKDILVTNEEQRNLFLEILNEVDSFCRRNELRYSIAYGTLLGAIRHKGFIPWDDDVDICMPYSDMIKLKEGFRSDNVKYCDVDTQEYYDFPFSRLCHLKTYQKVGLIGKRYGVNIDVYPVIGCSDNDEIIESFFAEGRKRQHKRLVLTGIRNKVMNVIPVPTIPGFKSINKSYRDFIIHYPFDNTNRFFHVGGPLKWYEVFNYDIFEKLIDVDFEGHKYLATARYDEYLTQVYGDYMTPPPEDKRHPNHDGNYYWKK